MQLSVFERLILLNILPIEGNITTLKIIRNLREELSFSEEEHKELKFLNEGELVKWDEEAGKRITKDLTIGEKAMDIIKERLVQLDQQKKLMVDHIPIYEKFVEGKE